MLPRRWKTFVLLLSAATSTLAAQEVSATPDSSVRSDLQTVLRAFYHNLETQNWDALASYVLSPKLMERRGVPADSQLVQRDRTRSRSLEHAIQPPVHCPVPTADLLDDAVIRIDGDWADVSVPRCSGTVGGVDELRLMYFEHRWRFIYTDLF